MSALVYVWSLVLRTGGEGGLGEDGRRIFTAETRRKIKARSEPEGGEVAEATELLHVRSLVRV
jgi:hypothetical protein